MHWSCAITPVKLGELALAPYSAFVIRTFFAFGRRRVAAIGSRAHCLISFDQISQCRKIEITLLDLVEYVLDAG
jgi:hypothetical protein